MKMPTLHKHLTRNLVEIHMFTTDWILTLFAILIPAEAHAIFMTNFLVESWQYFYKLVLTFLRSIEKELLEEEEIGNVLTTLKDLAATPG